MQPGWERKIVRLLLAPFAAVYLVCRGDGSRQHLSRSASSFLEPLALGFLGFTVSRFFGGLRLAASFTLQPSTDYKTLWIISGW